MEQKQFTITITCDENGDVSLTDSRIPQKEYRGKGMLLHLGDHWSDTYHNFAWGSGSSIVHSFMNSFIGAGEDMDVDADYYRYVYAHIAMNIEKATGSIRQKGVITANEAMEKYGGGGGTGSGSTH